MELATITELEKFEAEIEERIKRLQSEGAVGTLAEYRLTILQDGLVRCQQQRAKLEQEAATCNPQ